MRTQLVFRRGSQNEIAYVHGFFSQELNEGPLSFFNPPAHMRHLDVQQHVHRPRRRLLENIALVPQTWHGDEYVRPVPLAVTCVMIARHLTKRSSSTFLLMLTYFTHFGGRPVPRQRIGWHLLQEALAPHELPPSILAASINPSSDEPTIEDAFGFPFSLCFRLAVARVRIDIIHLLGNAGILIHPGHSSMKACGMSSHVPVVQPGSSAVGPGHLAG